MDDDDSDMHPSFLSSVSLNFCPSIQTQIWRCIIGFAEQTEKNRRWKTRRTTEAADKMWHFKIQISSSFLTKSNLRIFFHSLFVKLEISWLQRSRRGVRRWGLLTQGLYGRINGCNWTRQQRLNVGPTAYRTVIHSQTHTHQRCMHI